MFHGNYPQRIYNKLKGVTVDTTTARNNAIDGWVNCLAQLRPDADIVFFGDSITAFGAFNEYFPEKRVCNLGLSGDKLDGMLNRVNMIANVSPETVFVLGGINSLSDSTLSASVQEYDSLLHQITSVCNANVFAISVLPISAKFNSSKKCSPETIIAFNREIASIAQKYGTGYIDLYPLFSTDDNHINAELTTDGVHLTDTAYEIMVQAISQHID